MTQSLPPLSFTQSFMDPVFSDLDFSMLPEVSIHQDDYLLMYTVQPVPFLSPNPKKDTPLPVHPLTFPSKISERSKPLSPAIPIKALSSDRIEPLPALPINPEIVRALPVTPLDLSSEITGKAKKRKRDIIDLTNRPSRQVKKKNKLSKISLNKHIINYIKDGIDSRWSPYFGNKTEVLFTNFKQWNSEKGYTVINGYFQPTLRLFSSIFNKALPNLRTFTDLKKKTFIVKLPAQQDCLEYFEKNTKNISKLIKPRTHDLINQFMRYAIKENLDIFDREIQIKKVHSLFITFAKEKHCARLEPDIFHSQFASRFDCKPISKNQELFYPMPSIETCQQIVSIKNKKV